ncbi:SLC13 family permease [Labrenzia sp. CE80]|uniref:SLC13 family permease n=1 Tax=Labrenzia sp. CE80 TaxID=1788986 RepID=UPI00129B98F3|nr:SLC13 family permease [Labrenzia sp. CE80]
MTSSQSFAGIAALIAAAVVLTTSADDITIRASAVSLLAVVFFATRVVPEVLTAIWCFLAFLAIGAAPANVIFSGFATGGFWLLVSGLIVGSAITQTGLGKQIASRIFERTGTSYSRATLILALTGLGLGLLIPSTIPRIIILVPIAASLAEVMGHQPGTRGHIGLSVTAAASTLLPTYAILTANLPTIVHYGALETLYGIHPSYADYFIHQLPANAVRFLMLIAVMLPFAKNAQQTDGIEHPKVEPLTRSQFHLLGLLTLAIVFWATDSLHHISPAWIALTVASLILVPSAGFLKKDAMKTSIDLSPAFFLAGVFAVAAVATHTGLNGLVANTLIPYLGLGQGSNLRDLYSITGFAMLLSHLTTAPAAPLVLAPLAEPIAVASGWPIHTVAMAQVIGIATPLLPYQAPPLILAMALANLPLAPLVRVCLALFAGSALIGLPLTYFWWQFLGNF